MDSRNIVLADMFKESFASNKLKSLGYAFNSIGQLCKIDKKTGEVGNEPYNFNLYGNDLKNQAHYEAVAEVIPELIYELLEKNGLCRTYIPNNVPKEDASFFFTYPEKLSNPKKLLILIHGSGFVKAGQWARSLIINNSLDHGSQLPYIREAKKLNYDILITNTNDTHRIINGKRKPILGIHTSSLHATYIWENYLLPCNPEAVAIVAHSAGGFVTLELASYYTEFFKNKVFAIALTDSSHFNIPKNVASILRGKTCNWISSHQPLDSEIKVAGFDDCIKIISAGHEKHEWTSYTALKGVFKYLEDKYHAFIETNP